MKFKIEIFELYIFLITFFKGFGLNADSRLYLVCFVIGTIAVFLKILGEQYSKSEIFTMLFIITIGLLDFFIGKSTMFLFSAIAFCGLKNINERRLITITFFTRLVTFITMIILSASGLIHNGTLLFYRNGIFLTRYTFGFSHPNQAHEALVILIILSIYLYNEKFHLIHYVILSVVNIYLYQYTFSRTGLIVGMLCILFAIVQKISLLRRISAFLLKNIYIWIVLIVFITAIMYNHSSIIRNLDSVFTGRLYYNNILLTNNIPPLIGSSKYNDIVNIDNGFISLLYQGGVLAFLWLSYQMVRLTKLFYIQERYAELFFVSSFIIYGITESFFPNIALNISLIFIGELLFRKTKEKMSIE